MLRSLCLALVAVTLANSATAADKVVIALAATSASPMVAKPAQDLTENLRTLLELDLQNHAHLSLVERQQLKLALQEQAVARARGDAELPLGQLVTADLVATLEVAPKADPLGSLVMLRVTEAKTGAVRGLAVAPLAEATLEETAQQFSRDLAAIAQAPLTPLVTVAVAPFDSQGRFDRLRPLELGIRDLITTHLLQRSGALPQTPTDRATSKPPAFQVVQRSNLEQLLTEMKLIQSGLAKATDPKTLPPRQAAYLIRGQIDERQKDQTYSIVVHGEMLEARTTEPILTFEFECAPSELETVLAAHAEKCVTRLAAGGVVPHPSQSTGRFEVQTLKELALADLHRFTRLSPIDFSPRPFQLPGDKVSGSSRPVRSATPLGQYLIKKTVDRLESILFIRPDDAEATFGLAYCYAMHGGGQYRPQRARELYRRVFDLRRTDKLAAMALESLMEVSFHEQTGQLDKTQREAAIDDAWFAFEQMPVEHRDARWPRLIMLVYEILPQMSERLAAALARAAPYAETTKDRHQTILALNVRFMAVGLVRRSKNRPQFEAQGMALLYRWAEGDDPVLAESARVGLATLKIGDKDFLGAAEVLEESARKMEDLSTPLARHKHAWNLLQAAQNYRQAKQPERALRLIRSMAPPAGLPDDSLIPGRYGYEVGACFEALGQLDAAREEYLKAAETCPSIVDNTDLEQRVAAVGGVPLREDRNIDVAYIRGKKLVRRLATNGMHLFAAGPDGVWIKSNSSNELELLHPTLKEITCLVCAKGALWVGTEADGLWECDLAARTWTNYGTEQGLPDRRVESLAAWQGELYVGIGNSAAGGLVRIDTNGKVHVFGDPLAPRVAPTHLVITATPTSAASLLARAADGVYELSLADKSWTQHRPDPQLRLNGIPRLFQGRDAEGKPRVWSSHYGREIGLWPPSVEQEEQFKAAWILHPPKQAGYQIDFAVEHGDEIWFGGQPWKQLTSSGLYRFNLKTGEFHVFKPSDGFKAIANHVIFDGLWWQDQLWLATYGGLCTVTPRTRAAD